MSRIPLGQNAPDALLFPLPQVVSLVISLAPSYCRVCDRSRMELPARKDGMLQILMMAMTLLLLPAAAPAELSMLMRDCGCEEAQGGEHVQAVAATT